MAIVKVNRRTVKQLSKFSEAKKSMNQKMEESMSIEMTLDGWHKPHVKFSMMRKLYCLILLEEIEKCQY